MIGISFHYRIGALGFLPSKITAKEGLLNLGLRDQSLLLEWVQENIEAFGGDPRNVTIMGSSAGAHSVGHHLMANIDKPPLFHKVIMESGAPTARAVYPHDSPLHQKQFKEFLLETGCSNISEDCIMSHLRSLPVSTIVSASEAVFLSYAPSLQWAFQPVIDGSGGFIAKAPIAAWRSGEWHKVPILTGFNTNEGASFVPATMSKSVQFQDFFQTLLPSLSASDLDMINELYPDPSTHTSSQYLETRRGLGTQFKRVEAAYGHWAYIAPVRQTVQFASAQGLANPALKPPVFLYHFAVNKTVNGGANHGEQDDFITYTPGIVNFSKMQKEIAGTMHAYWTSFIVSGDPNAVKGLWPDRPVWLAYQVVDGRKMLFGEGNNEWIGGAELGTSAKVVADTWAAKECQFWWSKTDISER